MEVYNTHKEKSVDSLRILILLLLHLLLLCLEVMLIALKAQEGQVTFCTPVGKVSFFSALVTNNVLKISVLLDRRGALACWWRSAFPCGLGSGGC